MAIVDTGSIPVYLTVGAKAAHYRELGMSDRAIAHALGISDKTVAKAISFVDHAGAAEQNSEPDS